MDLSNPQESTLSCLSTVKNRKRKAPNKYGSIQVIPAKRVFYSPPTHRQNWSLPESIIYYLAKNPKSPELYQKLIKTCKYFFSKNPVIVCSDLTYISRSNGSEGGDEWKIEQNDLQKVFKKLSIKLWITEKVVIDDNNRKTDLASSIIPNIYRCDATFLQLQYQMISFKEYMLLTFKARRLLLKKISVKSEDGTVVPLEKLFEAAVHAKYYRLHVCTRDKSVSSETFKNLLKIPHFLTLSSFCLNNLPQSFDIEAFYTFMKKNTNTYFALGFSSSISDQYKARLESIVDEILETNDHNYKPPVIKFVGIDEEKYYRLLHLVRHIYLLG